MKFVLTYQGYPFEQPACEIFLLEWASSPGKLVERRRTQEITIDLSEEEIAVMKEMMPDRPPTNPRDAAFKVVAWYFRIREPNVIVDGMSYHFHRAAPETVVSPEEIDAYFNELPDILSSPRRPIS